LTQIVAAVCLASKAGKRPNSGEKAISQADASGRAKSMARPGTLGSLA